MTHKYKSKPLPKSDFAITCDFKICVHLFLIYKQGFYGFLFTWHPNLASGMEKSLKNETEPNFLKRHECSK